MTAPILPRRCPWHWLLRLLLLVLTLAIALVVSLPWWLPKLLEQQGIELHWQQAHWQGNNLQLQQLQLGVADWHITAHELNLDWRWQLQQPLQRLELGTLEVSGQLPANSSDNPTDDNFELNSLQNWLPKQLQIHQLTASIEQLGQIQGSLQLQAANGLPLWQPALLETKLELSQIHPHWLSALPSELQPHSLQLSMATHPAADLQADVLQVLDMDLHTSGPSQLRLKGRLSLLQRELWQAKLEQAQLKLQLPVFTLDELQLERLDLSLPFELLLDTQQVQLQLLQTGQLKIAQLQQASDSQLQQLDIQLPELTLQAALDNSSPVQLKAQFQTAIEQLQYAQLHSNQLQLDGNLALQLQPGDWQGQLSELNLQLQAPALQLDDMRLTKLQASFLLNGQLSNDQLQLQLQQPAQINLASWQLDRDTRLQDLELQLAELRVGLPLQGESPIQLQSSYQASSKRLQNPLLKPQAWQANGQIQGTTEALEASAKISNTSGLQLNSQWTLGKDIQGQINLPEQYLRGGNPLQASLTDWPELVGFDRGKLALSANLQLPAGKPLRLQGQLSGSGLGGIANRSELDGLSFNGNFLLQNNRLQLNLPQLAVNQLNPGVPLQRLQLFKAKLDSHLDALEKASLSWEAVSGQLLGGDFKLLPARLQLDRDNPIQLQLNGLQLQEALRLYPAEGLAGQATLDGNLPLLVSRQGVFIDKGQLQARQPGSLSFQSEQIRALGKSNPGMQLVAEALEDFHFSLLSSKLNYEPSGKLLFNIRLEGRNPSVEDGRPIHLNLNLEEDLPALLASIQLSNHVSETIQERIHQRLQNR